MDTDWSLMDFGDEPKPEPPARVPEMVADLPVEIVPRKGGWPKGKPRKPK